MVKMVDDVLIDFLHMELVGRISSPDLESAKDKVCCLDLFLADLQSLSFIKFVDKKSIPHLGAVCFF